MLAILISAVFGYFLGSIPFGLLLARTKGLDIRQHGSKNIGATNVWRVCGWKLGLPVFLLDALKGVVAVVAARWMAVRWGGDLSWAPIAGAVACILGHSFPVWLNFKGGKGVATSLGVFLALLPVEVLVAFGLWVVVFFLSRYVSLASIVAALALGILAIVFQLMGRGSGWPCAGFAVLVALLVIVRHKSNIQRLLGGTENRFGKKKEAVS